MWDIPPPPNGLTPAQYHEQVVAAASKHPSISQMNVTYISILPFTAPEPFHVEFTLFPNLPVELRLKIWALTMLPRIIEYNTTGGPGETSPFTLRANPYTPALLHVNHESREEDLRHYESPKFLVLPELPTDNPRMVYFNPRIDTLSLFVHFTTGPSPSPFMSGYLLKMKLDVRYLLMARICWGDLVDSIRPGRPDRGVCRVLMGRSGKEEMLEEIIMVGDRWGEEGVEEMAVVEKMNPGWGLEDSLWFEKIRKDTWQVSFGGEFRKYGSVKFTLATVGERWANLDGIW